MFMLHITKRGNYSNAQRFFLLSARTLDKNQENFWERDNLVSRNSNDEIFTLFSVPFFVLYATNE